MEENHLIPIVFPLAHEADNANVGFILPARIVYSRENTLPFTLRNKHPLWKTALIWVSVLLVVAALFVPRIWTKKVISFSYPDIRLLTAIREGHSVDEVKALLDAEPRLLKEYRWDRMAPIHLAAEAGRADLLSLFLERGADVNARTNNGHYIPIDLAIGSGKPEAVRVLIQHGSDLRFVDYWEQTPLQRAESGGNPEIVKAIRDGLKESSSTTSRHER